MTTLAPSHIRNAPPIARGAHFEDFPPGRRIAHRMSRTVTEADTTLFSTSMLAYDPVYVDLEAANAAGHRDLLVNPLLVFCCVLGLSVEDLSEAGGAFLGIEELRFESPVYPGDTLSAESIVLEARPSRSRPEMGIVTWRTEGRSQSAEPVISFRRTNLVPRDARVRV